MNKKQLIKAINDAVNEYNQSDYSYWTIGITNNPTRRKKEHGNPKDWKSGKADSEKIAREVEEYFLDKGMDGGTGGGDKPVYVYIF